MKLRGRAGVARVRPGSRLGEPERGQSLARREVGEPARLLLFAPVHEDRHRPERGVRGDRDRDGRVDPRQLLDRDRVRDGVAAGAAVLLGDRKPHEAELGQLGDEVVREAALEVELRGDRCHALSRERSHGVADELLLGREVEVHAAPTLPAR